ncbi:hypothetical protein [Lentzea guizhouensis]|uniref:hypothetical protein n=1 Tax=Lentzea guizhouensis TaxID=1586287 RepID=UPI0012B6AAA8|nr:hypothetical protein [Lentzea guizhouensis]
MRDGVAPAIPGLTSPRAGTVESYVTKPELPATPAKALVLSAAPGSVRGGTLLGAV